MNKDKVIKDLKERNDKLQSQYMQEQARNYHLNYVIDKAIGLIKELACYEQDTHTYCRDIIYYDVQKIVDILKGKSE